MHQYLKETEHAVKEILKLIHDDSVVLKALYEELSNVIDINKLPAPHFERNETGDFKLTSENPKHVLDASEELEITFNKIAPFETRMRAKEHSISVLSGAVLQIAKQGLSSVYGKEALQTTPNILNIAGVPIQNIIWHGRNQALHFEQNEYRAKTKDMFDSLAVVYGSEIALEDNPNKCLAKNILDILNWKTYEDYLKDMKAFLR